MDALYYGQELGRAIHSGMNKDTEGNSLLARVAGGEGPLSLVRVVLKWGDDINAVNNRRVVQSTLALILWCNVLYIVNNHRRIIL